MSGIKSIDYKDPLEALSDLCNRSEALREASDEDIAKQTYKMMDSGEVDHLLCCEIAERLGGRDE